MTSNNNPISSTDTDPISILALAPGHSEADAIDTALSRHGFSVSTAFDLSKVLDELPVTDVECVLIPDTIASIPCEEIFEAIREQTSLLPVVFLLSDPTNSFVDRIEHTDTAVYITGDVESVSYDRLADRIRTVVATYRTSRARRTERDIVERLEDRLYETERKITALHSVAMDLNMASSIDEVYQETIHAAETILDLDICFAFAVEDDTFVPKAQSSTPTDRELSTVPIDAGVMGETYRTGESDRTVDMDLHALADPEFGDYQSGISVPLGDFGVFQAVSTEVGAFDEIDLELTELLTAHAASVLQRLEFEAQLRVERDRYAALFENSTDCILEAEFVDQTAIIRSVNPAFEEVFGYTEDEVRGREADKVVVSEERRDEARSLTKHVHEGEFVQAEVRRQTSDGLQDFLLRSVPVDDDRLYAVYTDITDQKETERTIAQQRERLDSFTSTVSHDLRNPLNVAQTRLDLARRDHDNEHLAEVSHAHDRIEALIDDLLVLAREGNQALSIEPVSLATVAENCWEIVGTAEASLTVEAEQAIRADEGQLRQLIENLVRNAIEHGGADITVIIGTFDDGFYIEDNGPGIPQEARKDVFEPGYSTAPEGTGFGLSIVKQVVEAHDWEINVTEGSDGGARFEVSAVTFAETWK